MAQPLPTLAVMAAGAGSRFGGLKQLTPVDAAGHPIIDFSLYDARRAGFERVCFIIRKQMEADFRAAIGDRMEKYFEVRYVCQEPEALPPGFALPEGRTKPWGTAHAVACCRGVIDSPFAVINADDFYGAGAFRAIYDFLAAPRPAGDYAMVGYRLRNTVTEHGSVSRGVCSVEDGLLRQVTERVEIVRRGDAAAWLENGVEHPLSGGELVSMNFWGFGPDLPERLWERFPAFLSAAAEGLQKREYFLPDAVGALLREGLARVHVLDCDEVWHGVTYREDLEDVRRAVEALRRAGVYPEMLWT
ncbi:MAG: NTP transferase domain-containing protein [Oscillospiraceae bacterium]|nr:NTP transferase domain-containing protein [Oscillospiraceae bacterium]